MNAAMLTHPLGQKIDHVQVNLKKLLEGSEEFPTFSNQYTFKQIGEMCKKVLEDVSFMDNSHQNLLSFQTMPNAAGMGGMPGNSMAALMSQNYMTLLAQ